MKIAHRRSTYVCRPLIRRLLQGEKRNATYILARAGRRTIVLITLLQGHNIHDGLVRSVRNLLF